MNLEQEPKLESWKEIAAYLQRDVKTAHRWEKTEGLPVHRHSHRSRSSVYAYAAEIDAWRAGRRVAPEPVVVPLWKKPAFAAAMAMSLVMAGSLVRPQAAEAQGQTRTSVCAGQGCEQRILTPSGKLVASPVPGKRGIIYSRDGAKIAYSQRSGPASRETFAAEQISVANSDGSNARVVYRGAELFDWSADGKRLLLGVIPPDKPIHITNLMWLDLASGATQKLPTIRPDLDAAMVWPDGKYIAFNASMDSGDPNIYIEQNVYIMASDGSGETAVAPSAGYQEPIGWMRDGTLLYGVWGAKVNVWAMDVSKGKVGAPFKTNVEFPKGPGILGVSRSGALYYRMTSNPSDIFTATLDGAGNVNGGRTPVPVSEESAGVSVLPRWSPDSKQIAYLRIGPPREMYVYSFETGKEQRVAAAALITGSEHCWSRDGLSLFLNDKNKGTRLELKTNQLTPMNAAEGFPLATCSGDVFLARAGTGVEMRNGGGRTGLTLWGRRKELARQRSRMTGRMLRG